MKKLAIALVLALALSLALAAGAAESWSMGEAFPDFTATDTEGNTFTLSEALGDHDAVLINFWATWCYPCRMEFPYLQKAWEEYGGRVAFIALSAWTEDTMEMVADFRAELGLGFPMGLDADARLFNGFGLPGYPCTIIVDRFGKAAFVQVGAFESAGDLTRTLDFYLSEAYTETTVLQQPPEDRSTRAFPVFPKRAVRVENEDARRLVISVKGGGSQPCYIVPGGMAHLRIEVTAEDNPLMMGYEDMWGSRMLLTDLLDAERGVYAYEHPAEATYNGERVHYSMGSLYNRLLDTADPEAVHLLLVPDEAAVDELVDRLHAEGYADVEWAWAEEPEEEDVPPAEAYIVHVVDQNARPVAGVYANFCTDSACVLAQSDENGILRFDGPEENYHLQLIKAPEGYSFDAGFELYTGDSYSEWMLYLWKD